MSISPTVLNGRRYLPDRGASDDGIKSATLSCFTASIAVFPLLDTYVSPIPGISIGLLFYFLAAFALALVGYRWRPIMMPFVAIMGYIALSPIFMQLCPVESLFAYPASAVLLRYAKLLVCLCVYYLSGVWRSICVSKLMSTVRVVAIAASVFLLVQRVAYLGGVVIPNPLSAFSVSDLYYTDVYTMGAGSSLFRPSAFFLEPSHAAYYILPYIMWVLFDDSLEHGHDMPLALLASIGVLATGSGMGFILIFGIWVLFGVTKARHQVLYIGILIAVAIGFAALLQTEFFQMVVSRFADADFVGGNAIEARLGLGMEYFYNKPVISQLFGSGYGNTTTDTYYNGLTFILNSLGIVGLLVIAVSFVACFKNGSGFKRLMLLFYCGILTAGQLFTAPYLVLYGAYIICPLLNHQALNGFDRGLSIRSAKQGVAAKDRCKRTLFGEQK